MPKRYEGGTSARTVLEQLIRDRRQTFEEFVCSAETFARDHGESGTLSVRHLQRLVAGHQPQDTLRPATARLLERILGVSVGNLLAAPTPASDTPHLTHVETERAREFRVAIAVIVNDSDVLIVRRRDSPNEDISWQFPAGVVKPGMQPEIIAVREAFGETGVHCAADRTLGCRLHPITKVLCNYVLCRYLSGEAKNLDHAENTCVTWVDKATLTRFIPSAQIYAPVLDALSIRGT